MKTPPRLPVAFLFFAIAIPSFPGNTEAHNASEASNQQNAVSADKSSAVFFVAPNGNDSWSGKMPAPNATKSGGPFASLAGAQVAVQRLLIKGNPHLPINISCTVCD